jgi:hypothetical protein
LLHPNCRHSLSAYLPGLTEAPTNTADPEGDAERQRLRALERRLRRLRTQEAAALDDAGREKYGKLATKAQGDIREFVKDKKNLMRKPERELVNLGLKRKAVPVAAKAPAKTKAVAPARVVKPRVVKPKAPKRTPEQIAADYNAEVGNPAVVTGGEGKWFDRIPHDTGLEHPIPVRDYVIDGYNVKSGQMWRIDGKSYLVEDRPRLRWANDTETIEQMLPGRAVVEQFERIHKGLPGADDYQDGYAWLAGRNPADDYWSRTYNRPGFESLATAGDRGVRVWNRGLDTDGPGRIKTTFDHEFGHNVSKAARRHSPELDDGSDAWEHAVRYETSEKPINWEPGRTAEERRIRFGGGGGGQASKGCTEYGTSSEGENYAESMSLYLAGSIGTGRLRPGGPIVNLYFRDIWPKRAALFDQLFPGVAAKQRAATALRPH